jgi:carotenoid cleavage dioxygenase-like enzyme
MARMARHCSKIAAVAMVEDGATVWPTSTTPDRSVAELAILAAQGFAAEPIARVHLPGRIPPGFQGSWIAGQ